VVARLKGKGKGPSLHISAHIDTSPIQSEGWTHDPLAGEVTKISQYGKSTYDTGGGYIWGRGVCDDKGPLAAAMFTIKALSELDIRLRGDLILTGNCDEEIGESRGSATSSGGHRRTTGSSSRLMNAINLAAQGAPAS
jgi:acetylornithine deacetylase/succinyl-diaminopimelate desuccinylase-like protein